MFLPHTMVGVKSILKVCGLSSGHGVTEAFKSAKKYQLSFNANVSLPTRSRGVVPYAHNSRFIPLGNCDVVRVFKLRNIAKVFNSVVGSIAVNVVNLPAWVFPVYPSPRHSVSGNPFTAIGPSFVPVAVYCGKRGRASVTGVKHPTFLLWRSYALRKMLGGHVLPSETARTRVVVKKTANIFNIHCKPLWLIHGCNTSKGGVQHVR